MDELYSAILDYQSTYSELCEDVLSFVYNIIIEETESIRPVPGGENYVLNAIVKKDIEGISKHWLDIVVVGYQELSEEARSKIINRIIDETLISSQFLKLEQKRKRWEEFEKKAINCLELHIRKIRRNYSK